MISRKPALASILFLSTACAGFSFTTGLKSIDSHTNLTFQADLRLRLEEDWDAHTAAGAVQADRSRARLRARFGMNYQFDSAWSIGARLRTGSNRSQQSPHLTFLTDEGKSDDPDVVPDRYFVQYKKDAVTAWGGRNTLPFWQQNELFWDEDVTPTGVAGSYDASVGEGKLSAIGGAFYLPDGGYDLNGRMLGGQLKYVVPVKPSQITVASGLYFMDGRPGARFLQNRNGERDYLIGQASAQWSVPVCKIPLALGVDVMNNFESYSAADAAPFAAPNKDEKFGYVLSAQLGQLKQRNDWLLGYYYAHVETFAVNASYAQDDWFRFGNGPQTNASNYEGHELRLGYAFSKNINLLARAYFVESITTKQDGNRFRLDLNWKF